MKKCAGIYRIVIRKPDGTDRMYVGQSHDMRTRLLTHRRDLICGRHFNRYLQSAFNKYGLSATLFEIVIVCAPDRDILAMYEQIVVDSVGRDWLFNIKIECVISSLGTKASPERIAKIAAAIKGIKRSPETRAKVSAAQAWKKTPEGFARMSAALKGIYPSEETRAKMSASHIGQIISEETKEKRRATLLANVEARGSWFTPEARARMAAARKKRMGIPLSAEHRAKLSASWKGRCHSEEAKIKIGNAHRGRKQSLDTIEKNRLAHIGIRPSEETRKKLSIARIGKKRSLETREKIRFARMAYLAKIKTVNDQGLLF